MTLLSEKRPSCFSGCHQLSKAGCGRLPSDTPTTAVVIGPILWGNSGPLCHALSLLLLWTSILHCHSPGVATVARHLRYSYSWLRLILVVVSTVATPGGWQCKIRTGGMRRLAVAKGPNIFQMLLVLLNFNATTSACRLLTIIYRQAATVTAIVQLYSLDGARMSYHLIRLSK